LDFPSGDSSKHRIAATLFLMQAAAQWSPPGQTLQQRYNDFAAFVRTCIQHPAKTN
jgi:hypothetical protein